MSIEQRLASRAYQLRRWAVTPVEERKRHGQVGNRGLRVKFVRQAAESGITDLREIELAADRLYRAHMADMSRAAAAKRRRTN